MGLYFNEGEKELGGDMSIWENLTAEDINMARACATRAQLIYHQYGLVAPERSDYQLLAMDFAVARLNNVDLRLLLVSSVLDFVHDIEEIRKKINRRSGGLFSALHLRCARG